VSYTSGKIIVHPGLCLSD